MFPSRYLTLFSVRMKLYHEGRVGVEGVPAVTGREGRETNWTGNRSIAGDTSITLTLKSRFIFLI